MGTGVTVGYSADSFSEAMEIITAYLPILIPLVIIQIGLMLAAIIHMVKNQNFKTGNLVVWLIIVLLFNTIGPILYFIFGRGEPKESGDEYDD